MVTEVARSLAFAPRLHAMADRVVAALTDGGRLPFNGVHLRVEKDARDWASIMGGTQVGWHCAIEFVWVSLKLEARRRTLATVAGPASWAARRWVVTLCWVCLGFV